MVPGDHAAFVKSPNGIDHSERKLQADELESYRPKSQDEIPRLLDPDKSLLKAQANSNAGAQAQAEAEADSSSKTPALSSGKTMKEKSVKENLELLNTIRENNRKMK